MKKALFAAVMLVVAASAARAEAQLPIPLAVEGRVDYAVPTGDFDDEADEGVSLGAGISVGVTPGLGLYATYSNTRFGVGLTDDEEPDAEDSGFSVGLTTLLPGTGRVAPWVGAGAVFHTFEYRGEEEGIDEEVGFEVGGGLTVALGPNVRLTPGVGYRRYSTEIDLLVVERELDVSYFTAGVGLNLSF